MTSECCTAACMSSRSGELSRIVVITFQIVPGDALSEHAQDMGVVDHQRRSMALDHPDCTNFHRLDVGKIRMWSRYSGS